MRAVLLFAAAILLAPWLYARWAEPIVYMDNWPDGAPKQRTTSTRTVHGDYVFDGPSQSFHANGQIESEGLYRRGREHGPWRWYREDGSVLAECVFDEGDGDYRSYHRGGSLWWEGRRANGQRSGRWIARDELGRKIREGDYVEDLPQGEWQYWSYEDSTDHYTGRWERGVLLEEGAPTLQDIGFQLGATEHALQFAQWFLWMLAPWPLAFVFARGGRGATETALATLVIGLCMQMGFLQLLLATGSFHPAVVSLCAAALLIVGVWRLRSDTSARVRLRLLVESLEPSGAAAQLLLFAAFVVLSTRAWTSLVEAPSNFDSLAYHLPIMTDWVQTHALSNRPELGQVAHYAFGWETLGAASMLLLSEDAFIALPNLFAWCALFLAVVVLSRRIGVSAIMAAAAALLILFSPEILRRLAAIQPDLAVAAFALAALCFTGFPSRARGPQAIALVASCGLLLAVKMSSWVYLAAGAGLVLAWRRPGWPPRFERERGASPWLMAIGSCFVGFFWYARNFLSSGNPLGFLELEIGPWIVWPGELSAAEAHRGSLARLFEFGNAGHLSILSGALHESFGVALWFALAATVIALIHASMRAEAPRRASVFWLLASSLLAFAIYWNTPYSGDNGANGYLLSGWMSTNTRFAFPAVALLSVFAASGLAALGRWGRSLLVAAVLVAAVWAILKDVAPRYEVLFTATLIALLFCSLLRSSARRASWVVAALVVAFGFFSHGGRNLRHENRLQNYGSSYEYVLRHVSPELRLGYAMTQRRYPFVGPRLDYEVISAVPFRDDRASWFDQLDRDAVDVLLVGRTSAGENGRVNPEDVRPWLEDEGSPFELKSGFQSQRRDIEVWRRR